MILVLYFFCKLSTTSWTCLMLMTGGEWKMKPRAIGFCFFWCLVISWITCNYNVLNAPGLTIKYCYSATISWVIIQWCRTTLDITISKMGKIILFISLHIRIHWRCSNITVTLKEMKMKNNKHVHLNFEIARCVCMHVWVSVRACSIMYTCIYVSVYHVKSHLSWKITVIRFRILGTTKLQLLLQFDIVTSVIVQISLQLV